MIEHKKANNKIRTQNGLLIILIILALIFVASIAMNKYYKAKVDDQARNTNLLLPNSFKPLPTDSPVNNN